jgi:hypothetical protein
MHISVQKVAELRSPRASKSKLFILGLYYFFPFFKAKPKHFVNAYLT